MKLLKVDIKRNQYTFETRGLVITVYSLKRLIQTFLKELFAKPYCFFTGHSYTSWFYGYVCTNCGRIK